MNSRARWTATGLVLAGLALVGGFMAVRFVLQDYLLREQRQIIMRSLTHMSFTEVDRALKKDLRDRTQDDPGSLLFPEAPVRTNSALSFYTSGTTMIRVEHQGDDVISLVVRKLEYR
ncbi:MAG: hypothetical protein HYV35_04375 [Lentisphaerae bacterium]|nr:hypothetical protein [Lentisphaerota bacterium]